MESFKFNFVGTFTGEKLREFCEGKKCVYDDGLNGCIKLLMPVQVWRTIAGHVSFQWDAREIAQYAPVHNK